MLTMQALAQQRAAIRTAVAALTAPGADFETGTSNIGGIDYTCYSKAPPNLATLYQLAQLHGQRDFLVYQGQRLSFAETFRLAVNFSVNLLQQFQLQPGDKVAIAMRNNPEWVIAFMGVTGAGLVAVPLNSWWGTQELEYALVDSGARVVVADPRRIDSIAPLRSLLPLQIIAVGATEVHDCTPFDDLLAGENANFPGMAAGPDDDVTILYTSGSTGYPKGAVSTHRGIVSTILSWVLTYMASVQAGIIEAPTDATPQAVALLTVPLFHVTGSHSLFLLSLVMGRKLVMMYKWDVDDALRLIEQERVTYFNGVPTMSHELLNAPNRANFDLSSLKDIYSGGAARPAQQVARLAETFAGQPGSGYGLTETNALCCVASGDSYLLKPGSVGQVVPAVTRVRIEDETGTVLATGEVGEICIHSPANVRCYWNKPEATAAAFRAGWFHTGDAGYIDADGDVFIVDRIKDIIIRGGENISCLEVEEAIYASKEVAEVAVFGLPDERLGEIVAAMVYLVPGKQLSEAALRAALAPHVASYKIPAHILFSPTPLPRIATGKIFKREIKEQVRKAMAS